MKYLFHSEKIYSAVNVTAFQYTTAEANWHFPRHRHRYYEFLFCNTGKIKQTVENKDYILTAGDVLIIQTGFFHETTLLEDSEFVGFHFSIENSEISRSIHSTENILIKHNSLPELNSIITDILGMIYPVVGQNKAGGNQPSNYSYAFFELELHSYILLLLAKIAKHNLQQSEDKTSTSHENLLASEIAETLNESVYDDLKINELADKMFLHRSHLTTIFTNVYGISPKEYFLNLKLEKAKELLLNTNDSIEEIAEKLHFSSSSHFSSFFKKRSATSPSNFRDQDFF